MKSTRQACLCGSSFSKTIFYFINLIFTKMDRNEIEMVVLKAETSIKEYKSKIREIYGDEDENYSLYIADVQAIGRFCPTIEVLCDLIKNELKAEKASKKLSKWVKDLTYLTRRLSGELTNSSLANGMGKLSDF